MKNPAPMVPDGDTFTSRNLGAAGRIWISSVKVLTSAGLIKRIRDYTPIRYKRCVSRAELQEWIARNGGA